MVIKTKNIETEVKIFINICQSEAINPPSNRTQLDENGVEQEGIHVPISLGPKMNVKDNKGVDAHAYDFIVNPKVVKDAKGDKTGGQRHFLVQLCMQYVYNKYKEQCDQKYKVSSRVLVPALYVLKNSIEQSCDRANVIFAI